MHRKGQAQMRGEATREAARTEEVLRRTKMAELNRQKVALNVQLKVTMLVQ